MKRIQNLFYTAAVLNCLTCCGSSTVVLGQTSPRVITVEEKHLGFKIQAADR